MKALEMALEALTNPSTIAVQHAIELIRQALAQPEQKLIGWKDGEPQYVAQPEQEFKYTLYGLRSDENGKLSIGEISQREWVGLTDEDCIEAQKNSWNEYKNGKELKFDGFKLCKNIEQILKAKNNG